MKRSKFIFFGLMLFLALALLLVYIDNNLKKETALDNSEGVEEVFGGTHEVNIKNFAFARSVTRIKLGDTVVWINHDMDKHSVVSASGEFESELLEKDESYSYTFKEAGRFGYGCGPHPYMKGTVVVI